MVEEWWRENRLAAPTLFADELRAALEQLKNQPLLGTEYERVGTVLIRRVLLPRSAQHVYYAVDEQADVVVIHTVWGARRARPPNL